jgi:glycosyltransferase involved in cell wall biosynthesis
LQEYLTGINVAKVVFPFRKYVKFTKIRYFFEAIISNILTLYQLIKINPDLIFMNTEMTFYDLFPTLYLFRNKKIIYRIGDAPDFRGLRYQFYNAYVWENFVCKYVNTFVSVSDFIKKEVEKSGRLSNNDVVIHNIPPLRTNISIKQAPILRIDDNNTVLKFGFIGQTFPKKGVRELLLAFEKLLLKHNNIELLIAGIMTSEDAYHKELMQIKNRLSDRDKIQFLGYIDNISVFFENIDVLCVPTQEPEPFGNVTVEAKMYKTPSIITPVGGMPELIEHTVNGYICKGIEVDDLVEGMNYYLQNRHLIAEQGEDAYNSLHRPPVDMDNFDKKWIDCLYNLFSE